MCCEARIFAEREIYENHMEDEKNHRATEANAKAAREFGGAIKRANAMFHAELQEVLQVAGECAAAEEEHQQHKATKKTRVVKNALVRHVKPRAARKQ